ncbi:MAG: flagellar biosynthesis protein FlgI [Sphingobium sp.]|uniref:rod-binding protein n=1 Tax=Sphingobium sp. TaxID=1912891 RepID=UPI000DB271EE|nr:rod-binding protein [Sphingobium sp.]PZU13275.1 MAG: flagellar biosynthesis protein FlgI [Sphingobium sp.]
MQVGTIARGATPASPDSGKAALQKVAQQFEAVFLRQMIGAMRSASLAEGIGDSSATQQFQDMADARTADGMAAKGAMGIAELLIQQFGSRVAAAPAPASTATPNGAAKAESA